jgi:hypothetical protein
MAFSQNGWPALQSGTDKVHPWVIPGTKRTFVLRNGSAGFLLAHFILWFNEVVEKIGVGIWDDWGIAFRSVRGGTDLSNHASGTAVDLNATLHVLGKSGTFTRRQAALIRVRLLFYRGCVRWGGDYQNRKDEMHFEINRPLSRCEKRARKLMKTQRGKRILDANPSQRKVILS